MSETPKPVLPAADDPVVIDVRDAVLYIGLNRASRKNSLNPQAVRLIVEALEAAATNDSLRAIVIEGVGPDFCSGADWVASNRDADVRPRTGSIQRRTPLQAHRVIALIMEIQLPVVCVVRRWAAGLGCQIALAGDFTVAAESATFWLPFTQRGFTPDSGATWLIPRLVGVARARDLLILGRKVSGAQASNWGMIHHAVPEADLDAAATALVAELASAATVAVGLTKRCLNRALETGLVDAMENESVALELSSRTSDFREGLAAFTGRRPPAFEGR